MKKKLLILLLFTSLAFSSNRADVTLIEARENIQYLSQKMATTYCLFYNKPSNFRLQKQFLEDIRKLEKNILIIRNITKNPTTILLLNFSAISLKAIKALPLKNPTHAHITEVLKISELFIEATASLEREHLYIYNKEETMLVLSKELQFLTQRATKYYIAYQSNHHYTVELEESIQNINKIFKKLEKYKYPQKLKNNFLKSKSMWERDKEIFKDIKKSSFPNLLLLSTSYIKILLMSLEKHHKQKLITWKIS